MSKKIKNKSRFWSVKLSAAALLATTTAAVVISCSSDSDENSKIKEAQGLIDKAHAEKALPTYKGNKGEILPHEAKAENFSVKSIEGLKIEISINSHNASRGIVELKVEISSSIKGTVSKRYTKIIDGFKTNNDQSRSLATNNVNSIFNQKLKPNYTGLKAKKEKMPVDVITADFTPPQSSYENTEIEVYEVSPLSNGQVKVTLKVKSTVYLDIFKTYSVIEDGFKTESEQQKEELQKRIYSVAKNKKYLPIFTGSEEDKSSTFPSQLKIEDFKMPEVENLDKGVKLQIISISNFDTTGYVSFQIKVFSDQEGIDSKNYEVNLSGFKTTANERQSLIDQHVASETFIPALQDGEEIANVLPSQLSMENIIFTTKGDVEINGLVASVVAIVPHDDLGEAEITISVQSSSSTDGTMPRQYKVKMTGLKNSETNDLDIVNGVTLADIEQRINKIPFTRINIASENYDKFKDTIDNVQIDNNVMVALVWSSDDENGILNWKVKTITLNEAVRDFESPENIDLDWSGKLEHFALPIYIAPNRKIASVKKDDIKLKLDSTIVVDDNFGNLASIYLAKNESLTLLLDNGVQAIIKLSNSNDTEGTLDWDVVELRMDNATKFPNEEQLKALGGQITGFATISDIANQILKDLDTEDQTFKDGLTSAIDSAVTSQKTQLPSIAQNDLSTTIEFGNDLIATITWSTANDQDGTIQWSVNKIEHKNGTEKISPTNLNGSITGFATISSIANQILKNLDTEDQTFKDGLTSAIESVVTSQKTQLPSIAQNDLSTTIEFGNDLIATITWSTANDQDGTIQWSVNKIEHKNGTEKISPTNLNGSITGFDTISSIANQILKNLDTEDQTFKDGLTSAIESAVTSQKTQLPSIAQNDLSTTIEFGNDLIATITWSAANDQDGTIQWSVNKIEHKNGNKSISPADLNGSITNFKSA